MFCVFCFAFFEFFSKIQLPWVFEKYFSPKFSIISVESLPNTASFQVYNYFFSDRFHWEISKMFVQRLFFHHQFHLISVFVFIMYWHFPVSLFSFEKCCVSKALSIECNWRNPILLKFIYKLYCFLARSPIGLLIPYSRYYHNNQIRFCC